MSQSEQLIKIANGVVNFCTEMRTYLEDTKESFDTVLNRHYQVNHTPYAVMSFEDEAHYWEEQLAYPINKIVRSTDNDDEYLSRVSVLRHNSYVFIRGNLKSGRTIRYDETKYQQLYINGERYTGDYTFIGETPDVYERVTVFIVQTPYNITTREWGELIVDVANFPIENAEIYVSIGTVSRIQPEIEKLLLTDTAESLYVNGTWVWRCRDVSFIKTLSVSETLSIHSEANKNLPAIINYFVPNSKFVPCLNSKAILNFDIRNAGNIETAAFEGCRIKGHLDLSNTGGIGASTFAYCSRLTSVNIGNGVTSIGTTAFGSCSNLRTVIIGDNVTTISNNAFSACSLRILHFGKSVIFSQNTTQFSSAGGILTEKITVSKGYHSPYTYFQNMLIAVDNCLEIFKGILENCANVGEDGRTASEMLFRVHKDIFNKIYNASEYTGDDEEQLADKETALYILNLCTEKAITISQ